VSFTSLYGPNGRTIANSYYTGDLARLGKTGSSSTSVERTPQIKSRGYRIELGEIEAVLHSLPSLRDCAVVAGPSQGFEGVAIPTWTFPTSAGAGATRNDQQRRRGRRSV